MKIGGTLKVEIVDAVGVDIRDIRQRFHAMRSTLPLALNFAFRDVYPAAMGQLEDIMNGEKASEAWQNDVRKRLRHHWTLRLEGRKVFRAKNREAKGASQVEEASHLPVGDVWCSETSDHIVSRFKGEHLRDMLAGRGSPPESRGSGKAFFAEGRACEVGGGPDVARLKIPLWGMGRKGTELAVAPCGKSAVVLWQRLVKGSDDRPRIVELERVAKARVPKEGPESLIAEAKAARERAAHELMEMRALKLGKVGIKFDERKRKWFALISWTEHRIEGYVEGQAAAVNFGCHVLIQAVAEDGTTWERAGHDVLASRLNHQAARRRIARCTRSRGNASRGRGVKRREKVMGDRSGDEARFVQNWIRVMAADLGRWCLEHHVSDLYLENLSGIRDTFERKTGGDAPETMKRLIHQWPYHEAQQAIVRQMSEIGVRCHFKVAYLVSQRCPQCLYTSPDNVKTIDLGGLARIIDGELWRKVEKKTWFKCVECGTSASSDVIACVNHLVDVGKKHALAKMQEKAKERRGKVRRVLGGASGGGPKGSGTVAAE